MTEENHASTVQDISLEAEPPAAEALFGARIERARQFTADLAARGEELGLIGPLEMPRLWTRHILNSVLLAPLIKPGRVGYCLWCMTPGR